MPYNFGVQTPGSQYVQLAQMLGNQNSNNGTTTGGLATILQGALKGYLLSKQMNAQAGANETLARALKAGQPALTPGTAPGYNPATQFPDAPPLPAGAKSLDSLPAGTAVPGTGGIGPMVSILAGAPPEQGLGGMAVQLQMQDIANRQALAQKAADRAAALQNAITLKGIPQATAPKPGVDIPFKPDVLQQQIDLAQAKKARVPVPGVDIPLPDAVAKQKADIASARGGQFYLYPTGAGTVMLDKRSGVAQMVGRDQSGNLVGIGKPFKPTLGADGLPVNAAPDAGVSPLMPPSVDASAQGRTAASKAAGAVTGKTTATRTMNAAPEAARLDVQTAPLDRMNETVQELMTSPGLDRITGLINGSRYVPNITDAARNAQAKMTELKSQVAQNVLQMYRQMSQTGGAVGQVSNFEQEMFQNNLAALDQAQTTDEFKKQLGKLERFVEGSKDRLKAVYEATYGRAPAPAAATPAAATPPAAGGIKFLGFE